MKKVLMIVGSLRKNSFNLQLAQEIQRMLEDCVQVSFLEYADILNIDLGGFSKAALNLLLY